MAQSIKRQLFRSRIRPGRFKNTSPNAERLMELWLMKNDFQPVVGS